jgi:hypothetical protein
VIQDEGDQRSVDVIPEKMVAALASVAALPDGDFDRLAASWGETEEFEGWEEAEVADLLRLVGDLAETAQLEGKTLLLWVEL